MTKRNLGLAGLAVAAVLAISAIGYFASASVGNGNVDPSCAFNGYAAWARYAFCQSNG